MLARGGAAAVATRNSHRADIEAFLAAYHLPLPVHCVKQEGRAKCDVVAELLGAARSGWQPAGGEQLTAVFVDDDLREHLEPGMARLGQGADKAAAVHRVLFSARDLGA